MYSYNGDNEFVDGNTLILFATLLLLLFSFTFIKVYALQPLFIILIYGTLFWFVLRLIVMIALPESVLVFPASVSVRVEAINSTLVYLILSTMMVAAGFILSSQLFSDNIKHIYFVLPKYITLRRVLMLYIIISTIFVLGSVFLGAGRHWLMSFLTRLLNTEILLWIGFFIVLFGAKYQSGKLSRVVFIVVFSWGLVGAFFSGSRSGLLFVVLLYLIGVGLYHKSGIIRKKMLVTFAMIVLISPIMFSLATVGSLELRYGGYSNIIDKVSLISEYESNIENSIQSLGLRLSGLDTLAVIVNANETKFVPSKYINFENELKSIANTYVVGEPFPNALISEKGFHVVYQGGNEDIARDTTFTQKWSGYGVMFVKFGWYGGLVGTFILSFMFATIFISTAQCKNNYKHLLMVFLLYIFFNQLMSYGVESFILSNMHSIFLIGGVVNIFLLKALHEFEISIVRNRVQNG